MHYEKWTAKRVGICKETYPPTKANESSLLVSRQRPHVILAHHPKISLLPKFHYFYVPRFQIAIERTDIGIKPTFLGEFRA